MRKIPNLIMLIVFILASTLAAFAQQAPEFKNMNEKLPLYPDVKTGTFKNGITYFIKQNKKPEKRLAMRLIIKAGSVLENDDQKGLAHLTEHMCFNGTKNFPKDALVKYLESTGMRFGADLNAYTSFDETVYMLEVPTDSADAVKNGFQVLEDWAHNVSFDDTEIDKERGVVLEEWRLGKGAQDRVMKHHYPNIFYNSRYADRLPIGDTNVIEHSSYETLKSFYRTWYRPDLMGVVIVGDTDIATMYKLVEEHFANIPPVANPKERTKYTINDHANTIVSIATDKELPYAYVNMIFMHDERDESLVGSYRQNIVDQLMEGMLGNRYQEISRKPDPPFQFAQGGDGRFLGNKRAFNLIGVAKGDLTQTFETTLREAIRVDQHGFTASELERTKTELLRNMEQGYKERDKTESNAYASELVRHFLVGEASPGIDIELSLYKKFLPEITLDEVNDLAKRLIRKENLCIVVSAPEKKDLKVPTDKEIVADFDKIYSEQTEAYKDVVSNKPLFDKEVKPGTVKLSKEYKEIGVTELTLSNGVKVVLKPTDFKNDQILFRAFSPGGLSLAENKDYISASIADNVVDEAGIGDFDANTLTKMLTGKIVSVNPTISDLDEGFNGNCSPQDFETLLQLTHLYFTDPRKDNDAFKSFMSKTLDQIKNVQNSPDNAFRDTVAVILSQHNYRSRPMTEAVLSEANYDKAFEFYKERFANAGDFTFFFVGNFKTEEIIPMINKYLGSLPSTGRVDKWIDRNIEPPMGGLTKDVKKGIEPKSTVRLVIPGKFKYSFDELYKMNSMIEILRIRLREVVREDKSGVYGIGASVRGDEFPKQAYQISVGFGCAPTRVDELVSTVKDVINEVKDKPVSDENLKKVKEIQKREFEVNSKENRFWIGQLYNYYYHHAEDKMEHRIKNYLKMVEALSAKDVKDAADKYINMNDLIRVVLFPEK